LKHSTIRVSTETKSKLDALKLHEDESYERVLERETAKVVAVPEVDKSLEAVQKDLEAIRSKIAALKTEINMAQSRRFAVGPSSPEFDPLSEQIRVKGNQLQDLNNYCLVLERQIEQHQEEESKKALQSERARKERIIKFIRMNPPKCGYCGRSDKMRVDHDA